MSSMNVENAVVLAAGMGRRLRPMTERLPKPLLPVNGVPILQNCLDCLAQIGVRRAAIAIGHHAEKIVQTFGERRGPMSISYVRIDGFQAKNNVVSLWELRQHLNTDSFVIDGDVFFQPSLLSRLCDAGRPNVIAVDALPNGGHGAVVELDANSRVKRLFVLEDGDYREPDEQAPLWKTASVQLFGTEFLQRHLLPEIEATIRAGRLSEFYELAVGRLIERDATEISAVRCPHDEWIEVDDPIDYATAQIAFATSAATEQGQRR